MRACLFEDRASAEGVNLEWAIWLRAQRARQRKRAVVIHRAAKRTVLYNITTILRWLVSAGALIFSAEETWPLVAVLRPAGVPPCVPV